MFKLNYSKLTGSASKARISGSGSSTFVLPTNYESKLLDDMIGSDNKLTLNSLYREIYLYDNVSGPAVDLMSTLPWSDCVISGVSDPAVIRIYEDSLSELNIHALMIQLSVSYLVLGTVIGSLIFNEQKGIFTDLSIHDPDHCNVNPIPLRGYDPKIDLKVSKEMKKFLRSRDPRDKEALKEIPNELYVKLLRQDTIQLEPLNTIYLSRSSVPGINNISYYTRILPIWLIEKALMRGTIIGAWRRQRGITHITCLSGDTLISTEKGNVRLDKIVPHNPDEFNDITVSYPLNLKVQGIDGNFYLSTFWHYRGIKETITITTEKGRSLSCTSDHRILTVIDDNLQLVSASELLNKHICIVSEKSKSKDKVVNIKVNKKEPVYDLTMSSETSPVFIANNIVVKNCGTEEWDPTDEQLDAVTSMFINADQDPMGAVLTTRSGIDIQTASSGNDFWRVSDDWDVFTTAKMRALSINDEFLCLSGDTLISTENGLIPINKIYSRKGLNKDTGIDINLTIKGIKGNPVKAVKWWYRGKKEVLKVTTTLGYNFKATPKHLVRVLSKDLTPSWKEVRNLTTDDIVCIDIKGENIYSEKLFLDLNYIKPHPLSRNLKIPKKPKVMTPELAYIGGLLISDGNIGIGKIRFGSSNDSLTKRYISIIKSLFDLDCSIEQRNIKGEKYNINGIEGTLNHDNFTICLHSKQVSEWLIKLGFDVPFNKRPTDGTKRSYLRTVPWSILQSDSECQIAFIAGFIDGDGSVSCRDGAIDLTFYSSSIKMLNQLRVILANLGILTYSMEDYSGMLRVTGAFGNILYPKLQKYLSHSLKSGYTATHNLPARTYGIPVNFISDFLKERYIKRQQKVGEWFENDDGDPVLIKKFGGRTCGFLGGVVGKPKKAMKLLYSSYDQGKYEDLISIINQISPVLGKRLISLFKIKYCFDSIRHIQNVGKKHLYDLTIEENESPAFIANGIVVHNSGVSNFSTAEVALSSFMETQKAFRDFMTTNIIYNKIFLMLSKYHEIRKLTSAQLDHRIRIEGSKTQVIGQKNLSSANKYLIPTVHWMKDLSPKMDSAYLDTISAVSEKGVPIPLALFASAAGLNINNILDALEQDIEHRKAIAEYKTKLKPPKKGGGDEDSEEEMDEGGDEGMDEYGEEMTGNIPPELILTPKQASNILQLNAQKLSKR